MMIVDTPAHPMSLRPTARSIRMIQTESTETGSSHPHPWKLTYGNANTVTVMEPGAACQNPAAIPETTATYCLPSIA